MIAKAFGWWADGLAPVLLGLQRRIRRQRRFLLDHATYPNILKPRVGSRALAATAIVLPESLSANFLAQIRHRTRGSVFEIVIPDAALLERQLDPLPADSQPYVDNLVQHQIETLFPWSAKDVLHTARVKHRGDGKIDVTVRATSRSAVDPALSIATACQASELVLIASAGSEQHDAATISVAIGNDLARRIERAKLIAGYAIVALLVTGLCAIGWTTFLRWSAASELAGLERAISERRALISRAAAAREATGRGGLETRKLQAPLAVMVLETLSELLPDDTYLTDLTLEGERLRISGVSGQAVELVPLLEKSRQFRNASFYAPTTRMPGTSADRFSIEAVSRLEAKP